MKDKQFQNRVSPEVINRMIAVDGLTIIPHFDGEGMGHFHWGYILNKEATPESLKDEALQSPETQAAYKGRRRQLRDAADKGAGRVVIGTPLHISLN